MAFPEIIDFKVLGTITNPVDHYVPIHTRCIINSMQAACSVDPGDNITITVVNGSTAIGVLTFGATIAAGATGTWVSNTTTGKTICEAGDVLKLTILANDAASAFCGHFVIDPHCKTVQ
jgi:hypothetical protein